MSEMSDPHIGLLSYQEALNKELINPQPAIINNEVSYLFDDADGDRRLTFALTENGVVKGIAVYLITGNEGEKPYFQLETIGQAPTKNRQPI
jgi:hypothetical protein